MQTTPAVNIKDKKIVVFDLDGTLTETKSPMDSEMAELIRRLLGKIRVAVISGGGFGQFEKQLLSGLDSALSVCANLFLFPTTATRMYEFENGWKQVYADVLSKAEAQKIKKAFELAYQDIGYKHPDKVYGEIVEDRETQITFSALGQDVVKELGDEGVRQKRDFRAAHEKELRELTAAVAHRLPDFEVRLAGFTSIDVTRKGIDKGYGIAQIEKHLGIARARMVFVGDALYEGGNDYAAKIAGVECVEVTGPTDTKQIIRSWIKIL